LTVARVTIRTDNRYLLTWDKKAARQTFRRVGSEILRSARQKLRKGGSGRTYYVAGGRYVASAPGQPPAVLSGRLRSSGKATVFKSGTGVVVRFRDWVSNVLEHGARAKGSRLKIGRRTARGVPFSPNVLEPRPFLSTAIEDARASIDARVKEAILSGIEFRRFNSGGR